MIAQQTVSADDRLRLHDLYAEYAACLDDGRFDEWPGFFVEDCVYRLVSRENFDRGLPLSTLAFESKGMLRDRVYSVTQTLFHEPYYQRHLFSGLLAECAGDDFLTRANYAVFRTKAGTPSELYNVGRYVDRVTEDSGVLRFSEKICIFDSELIANSLIYPI